MANESLSTFETNKNGITYVDLKEVEKGATFEGYLVGRHMSEEKPDTISALIFQDDDGELFGVNAGVNLLKGIRDGGMAKLDLIAFEYGGKKKVGKFFPHQWAVTKGDKKLSPDLCEFNKTEPIKIEGL